jgi:hypothetical protein
MVSLFFERPTAGPLQEVQFSFLTASEIDVVLNELFLFSRMTLRLGPESLEFINAAVSSWDRDEVRTIRIPAHLRP